ncbi:MAG: HNH endonuclease, partial [Gordonia sp. (in: high G+C Gram-positive bacteria)]
HNRSVGKNVGEWETKLVVDGPARGRVAWRPRTPGRRAAWRVNPTHHAELLPVNGPHGPPAPEDSRLEAHLEQLLGA